MTTRSFGTKPTARAMSTPSTALASKALNAGFRGFKNRQRLASSWQQRTSAVPGAKASVVERLERQLDVACSAEHAFAIFSEQTDLWWPREHRRDATAIWFPGAAGHPTRVEVTFQSTDAGTRVTSVHTAPTAEAQQLWPKRVALFERGWDTVLPAFQTACEREVRT